jgi:Lysozyme like domain
MAKAYTYSQLEHLWELAGGSKKLAPTMAAIAMAESRGNPKAQHKDSNGTVDQGLWQINNIHYQMYKGKNIYDPQTNAAIAVQIEKSSGLHAWSTYNNGSYKGFLNGKVPAEAPSLASATVNTLTGGLVGSGGVSILGLATGHDPGKGGGNVTTSVANAVKSPFEQVGMKLVFGLIIAGGGALMLLGLLLIGADLGLAAAKGSGLVGTAVQLSPARRRARKAQATHKATIQGHQVALSQAKVKTEQARATELRTRTRHRAALAKQSKAASERTQRESYMKGAADAASPTMAAIRKKRGGRKNT